MPRFRYRALRAERRRDRRASSWPPTSARRRHSFRRRQPAHRDRARRARRSALGLRAKSARGCRRASWCSSRASSRRCWAPGWRLDRALTLVAGGARPAAPRPACRRRCVAAINRGESLSRALAAAAVLPPRARDDDRRRRGARRHRRRARPPRRGARAQPRDQPVRSTSALIYPASVLVVACVSMAFLLGFVVPRFAVLLDKLPARAAAGDAVPAWRFRCINDWAASLPCSSSPRSSLSSPCAGAMRDSARRWGTASDAARDRPRPRQGRERAAAVPARQHGRRPALRCPPRSRRRGMPRATRRCAAVSRESLRRIERGERVATALAAAGLVPELALELVRVGEETGDLAPMLLKASDILRQEIEATTNEWIAHRRRRSAWSCSGCSSAPSRWRSSAP